MALVGFVYVFSSMLPILLPAFLYLGLYQQWIPIYVLQLLGTLVVLDFIIPLSNGYRPSPTFKQRMDRIQAEGGQAYFPAKSIFLPTTSLSPDKAYILAAWPHGLFGGGNHFGFTDFTEQSGIFPIYSGADVLHYVPFVRRLLHALGFCSVTKAGLRRVLDVHRHGPTYPYNVVHLPVGGIHEMFYTPAGSSWEQIILSKRKGFIKLALETKADILPMYSFGANQTYYRLAGPRSWLCWLSTRLRVSVTPWLGRFGIPFGVWPCRGPVLSVTGQPFVVPNVANDEITDELVEKVHADFCRVLRSLFDTYKKVYVEEMGADEKWLTRKLIFEDES